MTLTCHDLAERVERLQPAASPSDVARLCLLLLSYSDELEQFSDDDRLSELWRQMGIRLQASTDQHAAMTEELDGLAQLDPAGFGLEQIWVLIRAIKVQSQVLQLYVGQTPAQA